MLIPKRLPIGTADKQSSSFWIHLLFCKALRNIHIDSNKYAGAYGVSLALDSNDKVHMCYSHPDGFKYATNVSGVWVNYIIYCRLGLYSSIAIDSMDKVHIIYNQSGLKYATNK